MLVKVMSWFDRCSVEGCSVERCGRIMGAELFVTVANGDSVSRDDTEGMFCNANIVADWGGVFSPRMLCGSFLPEGRTIELRFGAIGVGVPGAAFSFSADLESLS